MNVLTTLTRFGATAILLGGLAACATQTTKTLKVTADDYRAAEKLFQSKVVKLIKNAVVEPHWLGSSGRFWYRRDGDNGDEYVVVDGANGSKSIAFDHAALASALTTALGKDITPGDMGLSHVTISDDLKTLTGVVDAKAGAAGGATAGASPGVSTDAKYVACDLTSMACNAIDIPAQKTDQLVSANGAFALVAKDHNLFLTTVKTGKQRQLTTDGAPYYSYGKLPDAALNAIQLKKSGIKLPPFGAGFSPDERYLFAVRIDERKLSINPFVESVPTDGSIKPIVHEVRTHFVGDPESPKVDAFVFDTKTGAAVDVQKPEHLHYSADGIVGWSSKRNQVFVLVNTFGNKMSGVLRIDLTTGESTLVVEEVSDARVLFNSYIYNKPNVRVLGDGDEIVWFSERTGWGHLYLYDARTGKLKNSITGGDWLVQDIHQLDAAEREIYFTAGGREQGRDPYYRQLYKASLDGGPVTLLTDVDADHHFAAPSSVLASAVSSASKMIRPDLGLLIDTYSTVDQPPVTVLRSSQDGRIVSTLEVADVSALYAAGWQAPVRKAVKAADGITDIYAVYYAPKKSIAGGKHPIIDSVYGGPQSRHAPRNFIEAVLNLNPGNGHANSLTKLGFAVVSIDARGTPLRSKQFWRAGYPEFTQVGIDDHIAAIKQLAQQYPEIDSERVGVYGWSWGGTFAAQAVLSRPEFYDVAVSAAGLYDYALIYSAFGGVIGLPQFADGSIYRSGPQDRPTNWAALDVTQMAANLQGHLLIVYGDMDENVPASQAFSLVNALINANKPYDLLYLPNRTHSGGAEPYAFQRFMDYFVEHLLGATPPRDVVIRY